MSSTTPTAQTFKSAVAKSDIHFTSVKWSKLEDGTQYGRANIEYIVNGKSQELLLPPEAMNTYGVGDNTNAAKEVTGHSVCFIAPAGGSVTEATMAVIHEAACEYLVLRNEECGLPAVTSVEIAKAFLNNPLAHPKKMVGDKKITDTSKPKRIYAKLVEFKAKDKRPAKMVTVFDDATSLDPATGKMTRTLDPLTVRSEYEMIPSMQVDSIYFGSKPSLQIKLPRAAVTRKIGSSNVAAADDAVAAYMKSMSITTGPATAPLIEVGASTAAIPAPVAGVAAVASTSASVETAVAVASEDPSALL